MAGRPYELLQKGTSCRCTCWRNSAWEQQTLLLGKDSLANKAMDATAMTVGGVIGSVGGPLGAAAGAGIGKSVSDGVQWLFGDKKTPEQRKMELALAELRGGKI